jgi:hypothetical protein
MSVPRSPDVRFGVRLTPRSGATRVDGVEDGVLRVRVAAPPVGGAANEALLRLIADELDMPRGAIRLVAGESGRTKLVAIDGISPDRLAVRWPGLRL